VEVVRGQIIERLGARCVRCGFLDQRALQIDHVYSDGAEERETLSGAAYYLHILLNLNSGRYQLLCANCNWIKRFDNLEGRRRFRLEENELGIMSNEFEGSDHDEH
jgi:hypothetical protein